MEFGVFFLPCDDGFDEFSKLMAYTFVKYCMSCNSTSNVGVIDCVDSKSWSARVWMIHIWDDPGRSCRCSISHVFLVTRWRMILIFILTIFHFMNTAYQYQYPDATFASQLSQFCYSKISDAIGGEWEIAWYVGLIWGGFRKYRTCFDLYYLKFRPKVQSEFMFFSKSLKYWSDIGSELLDVISSLWCTY